MKTFFDHLENVKGKPHHVRKRVAFGSAIVGTSLVALVWLVSSLSVGAFALKNNSFAKSVEQSSVVASEPLKDTQNVAGVAGAYSENTSAPVHIEVIRPVATTTKKQIEQSIIPF